MDYEEGESLSQVLKQRGPLPEDELKTILFPLLDGLEKVHAAGITHRDIKPANILIRANGSPVLIDFGAARRDLGERTQSVFSAMSPAYAAIEQHISMGNIGPWTDIYALGATFYQAVTGNMPLPVTERLFDDRTSPAREAGAGQYSEEFLAALDAALAVKPEDRPQSIAEWLGQFSVRRDRRAAHATPLDSDTSAEDAGQAECCA